MKIAIISTQFAINYGAVLQAMALKCINNLGYECEILDFYPENNVDGRKMFINGIVSKGLFTVYYFFNFRYE